MALSPAARRPISRPDSRPRARLRIEQCGSSVRGGRSSLWISRFSIEQSKSKTSLRSQQRGAKIADLLIAAAAEVAGLVVLHYDRDFDLIAKVTAQRTEWIVPAGTVP